MEHDSNEKIKHENEKRQNYHRHSLYELLDNLIFLYRVGVHHQQIKTSMQIKFMQDNIDHIINIRKRMKYSKENVCLYKINLFSFD